VLQCLLAAADDIVDALVAGGGVGLPLHRLRAASANARRKGNRQIALALALIALAVAFGIGACRGEHGPEGPTVVGTYSLASSLWGLAPGFRAVWTVDPSRHEVLRIDPGSRRVIARIPVGAEARVATGFGAVWALAGELFSDEEGAVRLLRIDPATNRVVARIALHTPGGDGFGASDVQIDRDAVWIIGDTGVLRIDPGRNAPGRFVSVTDATGEAPHGTAMVGGSAWAFMLDGRIRRFDAKSGRIAGTLRVRRPRGSNLFGGHPGPLTIIGTKRVVALDPATARLLWRTTLEGDARWWTFADGVLWMYVARHALAPDRLVGLDGRSGRRVGQVQLPESDVIGMATVGREIWVAMPAGKIVVVRRRGRTGTRSG
jgi:hypothetical protein